MDSVLQIASKANKEIFDMIKREDASMYKALVELMKPEIDEAVSETTAKNIVQAIENAIKNWICQRGMPALLWIQP